MAVAAGRRRVGTIVPWYTSAGSARLPAAVSCFGNGSVGVIGEVRRRAPALRDAARQNGADTLISQAGDDTRWSFGGRLTVVEGSPVLRPVSRHIGNDGGRNDGAPH